MTMTASTSWLGPLDQRPSVRCPAGLEGAVAVACAQTVVVVGAATGSNRRCPSDRLARLEEEVGGQVARVGWAQTRRPSVRRASR
jgi:hypothetical protein